MNTVPATGLAASFVASADGFPGRPAVEIAGTAISYEQLRLQATAIAATLTSHAPAEPALAAVLASRSATAYAAVLGTLLSGRGYMPLNPRFPIERNRSLLERSGCPVVVVEEEASTAAAQTLSGIRRPLLVVFPERAPSAAERRRWAPHEAIGLTAAAPTLPVANGEAPAYLLFTSGSTGRPKGVLVRQAQVRAFLAAVAARYDFTPSDRFSQMFDLTFDLSAFDLFAAWEHGACVCCPSGGELLNPSSFIRRAKLTTWFSVPSVAMFLQRFRSLRPSSFPSLRFSLFCGEALPTQIARVWAAAAPASLLDNLYGPTEATIACTAHRWQPSRAADETLLVPIGAPLGTTRVQILDDAQRPLPTGQEGELVLSGPQVVDGYFDDADATTAAFVTLPGLGRCYRTGDRVVSREGTLHFLGRLDTQIKVLGHRVELEEVEAVIREEASVDAIALGWPQTETGAAGIVALVSGRVDAGWLRQRLAARLPDYMVPRELRLVEALPLNANGKRDRRAAAALLEAL